MLTLNKRSAGFTIVELLIVIVVIGILAAITIVAFNGIQERSKISSLTSAIAQSNKKIKLYQSETDQLPVSASQAGVSDGNGVTYQYYLNGSTQSGAYCLMATNGTQRVSVSSQASGIQQGACNGYTVLISWNKSDSSTQPVPLATFDTSTFRTNTASMRIGPNNVGVPVRGAPYEGNIGDKYTMTFWMKSDSNWNGADNNSKIRIAVASNGSLIKTCGYGGVKTTWTEISCDFTLTPQNTSISFSVGNDGTVGNIWIDDFTLVKSLQ